MLFYPAYVLSKLIIYYPVISPPSIVITVLGVPGLKIKHTCFCPLRDAFPDFD